MKEVSNSSQNTAQAHGGRQFAQTHWSVVLRAGQGDEPGAAALETLCRAYWFPVYAWIRGCGHDADAAKDLTQGFFASLLRRDSLASVHPAKGRFRTFLIRSIQYFLADEHARQTAAVRGGGRTLIELDAMEPEKRYALEPVTNDTPDAAFDRHWTQVLVTRALSRLEAEQTAAGRAGVMDELRDFIGGTADSGGYARAAQALGISQNAVAATVRRLRLRCREIIMEEIMETVETRSEAEAELKALFQQHL